MADTREIFGTLEDLTTNSGANLAKRVEGNASSGINGSIGFAFKDSSGNVILPQLTGAGQVPVSLSAPGVKKHVRGEDAAGSATVVTVATLALTATKVYADLNFIVSCRRAALFQIIWNDAGAETVLADAIVDAGQYSFHAFMNDVMFTAGATGTQQLLVKANNLDGASKVSALRATVDILELA